MTRGELQRLVDETTTVSFATACRAFGLGETAARTHLQRGDLGAFRVIRLGRTLRVPSVDLRALLDPESMAAEG